MINLKNSDLLADVQTIIEKNEEAINKTAHGFNLISLLGMEHNERYTHSKIIAELLNSKGSHRLGNIFFKLFLEVLDITHFDCDDYEVITEEYVGSIKCSDGSSIRTYLDIVIKEKTGRVLLIENKIWSGDQYLQLERYYDAYENKIVKLFYLNVKDYNYDPTSRTEVKAVLQNISYKNEIKIWLEKCLEYSHTKPLLYYQIEAYLQIILKITNQSIYQQMNSEIQQKITENAASFESAKHIAENYNLIINEIASSFSSRLTTLISDGEIETKYGRLQYAIAEDNYDPLYLGFRLYSNDRLVIDNEEFNSKIEILKDKFKNNIPQSNQNWNVWFSLSSEHFLFKSFVRHLTPEKSWYLYKNMDYEVEKAADEFQAILDEFKLLLEAH